MRRARRSLAPHQRQQLALALSRRALGTHLFAHSKHIAFYLPNDGETDLSPLMARARLMGKRCYLPVLSPAFHNRLWFAPYDAGTPLHHNQFGIAEPALPWRRCRPAWALDLILTPLVAFDRDGNRLGMGGGFYDRTLAYLARRQYWRKPRLVGVAFEFQHYPQLPQEPWDIPLDGVLTERELYHCHRVRL